MLALCLIAVMLFASTNIDDVFVLLGFLGDPKFRFREVALGQYLGIATLYAISVVTSLVSLVVPGAYVGLLGLAPIAIGLKKAWELRKPDADDEETSTTSRRGNVLTIAVVTIANGGDNIGVYMPFFSTHSGFEIAVVGVVFAVMTAIWLGAAQWLAGHPTLGAPIRKYGHRVVPFVLIALGGLILYEAGTLQLLKG